MKTYVVMRYYGSGSVIWFVGTTKQECLDTIQKDAAIDEDFFSWELYECEGHKKTLLQFEY